MRYHNRTTAGRGEAVAALMAHVKKGNRKISQKSARTPTIITDLSPSEFEIGIFLSIVLDIKKNYLWRNYCYKKIVVKVQINKQIN